ncbi:MAG TPA: helix-turn-helix domain-containing protein [Phycisphaerae bacterium]|jgi:HTH-type transcriptional regulator/antitoxin HigA|nr:helix-turn-helix domain-containing protein [Phycisphaerae bacterium]HOB73496.1 helix-turn-helix domain-containing protein [Phycisphaerae bacterium]HOJ54104.1 helix-turn-helix domain-containing protein [Phycisphaerae bacterium]HOL25603.1 helix-turn-helix domain-containing protein [Phycisphaerae bacterium]HPP20964.1 helix-turn-helix domain-containing protein [Phycisphaerae bacterium]
MSTTLSRLDPRKLPRSFEALNRLRPLYVIHDEADYENAKVVADALVILDHPTEGQERYLETLLALMEAYEREHHAIDTSSVKPLDVLKSLMQEHGMNGSDLGRLLGTRQVGGAILRGERELSKEHIRILARHFNVSPALFLEV